MSDIDFTLLARWQRGDTAAGNLLFTRHFSALYRFLEHKGVDDVDDLVQETLLECTKKLDLFKRQNSFRTYLFTIARNVLLRYLRRKPSTLRTLDFDEVSIASLDEDVAEGLSRRPERTRIIEVLRTLPLDQQLLLEMHYWEDFDRDQLAEIFEMSGPKIGVRLSRARAAMKALLESANELAPPPDDLDGWVRSFTNNKRSR